MTDDAIRDSWILIVEDDQPDAQFLQQALAWAGYENVTCVTDPRHAMATYLTFRPHLIILDLAMPHVDGYEILRQLRCGVARDDYLPILVFTGQTGSEQRNKALDLGASDFLTKPCDVTEIALRIRNFLHTRHLHLRVQEHNRQLEDKVRERTAELVEARREALTHLARAAEYRDDDTGEHTERVGTMSAQIAERLGLPRNDIEMIRLAAPLHDLGKIGIPDSVLLKPGSLDPDELREMRSHTLIGAEVLAGSRSPLLQMALLIAFTHHEHWDGSGYPSGLEREGIPLAARIVAIADVFDALTNERPYKGAWSREEALAEIERQSGGKFDPQVVAAFLHVVRRRAGDHERAA